jgi:hypothetical protein
MLARNLIIAGLAAGLMWTGVSAAPPASPPKTVAEVTVTAERERKAKQQLARDFVRAITVLPSQESAPLWRAPVCPLVAGFPRDQAEAILAHVTAAAMAAGAPVGTRNCRVNFYVVQTPEPAKLLELWRKRDKFLFGGAGGVKADRFIAESRPVRVWYNADLSGAGDLPVASDASQLGLSGDFGSAPTINFSDDTRLSHNAVRTLSSVLVIVDAGQVKGVKVGQLADYVALAGLADVNLDADLKGVPTILSLFAPHADAEPAPQAMTDWDRAYLKALYHTRQRSVFQRSEIAERVVRDVAK